MGILSKLFKKKEAVTADRFANKVNNTNSKSLSFKVKEKVSVDESEIPEYQGDYAKAIFLYAMSKPSPIKRNSDYVKYFLYECGIREPAKYHKQMIDEGYLEASKIEAIVQALKVDTLKIILKKLNLPVSGKKAILVKRVLDVDSADILKEYCDNQTYSISEKGKIFLKQHDDYIKIHKNQNWGISWKEYDSCKQPEYSFYDTIWGILNKRITQERTLGLMRNDYYNMYEVLCQEGKRKAAIEMLLRVLYLDLSGVDGIQYWDLYRGGVYSKKEILDTYDVAVMVAPGIIRPIEKFKDVYDDGMIERIYQLKLQFCCCDKKLFLNIVHSIIDGTYDEETVKEKVKVAYRRALKEKLNIK
ncbi:hypothetical protein [Clostridium tertium]|uniref:SAP domain protein n=1 Tax=Clostridium tertium TaxID=1559 RepID=A0A6N2Y7F2_9CLOT